MDNENNKPHDPGKDSPSERLRRILSTSKKEQGIKPISSESIEKFNQPGENIPSVQKDQASASNSDTGKASEDAREIQLDKEKLRDVGKPQAPDSKGSFGTRMVGRFAKMRSQIMRYYSDWKRSRGGGKGERFKRLRENPSGCLIYGMLGTAFISIIIGILGLSFLIVQYFTIAAGLPSVDDLRLYASQFETTRIYDRRGNLIYEILDPTAGRRTYTPLEETSPELIAATIATEDKDFYSNPGFDPWGIIRAFWQNYTSGEVVSGASTITQQLARTLLLSPEERAEISTRRKAREIVLAAEITRKYSKDEILEMYLNEIYYGNLAYGIEAAAETYFNTTADQLDLAQASFLAGLPQAPAVYDVFTNRDASFLRHLDILNLMYTLSDERGCIGVDSSAVPVCVTLDEAVAAAQQIENYKFEQRPVNMPFPHWVNYVRTQLEQQFDPQTIYRSGFRVYTTLDPEFQNYAQDALKDQVAGLVENNATDGALVAIQPQTGEILAMVGSADFFNEEISGQVNMAVSPRQPGSSIKPLTYTAAFEKGWTPATLIWDVRSEFPPSGNPDDPREPYVPVNYDNRYHGPVLARTALGSSYNLPAVKTLDFIGIYDDTETPEKEGFVAFAERMGITTLTRDDYGLSLTLGGGDVSLLELTGAYSIYANGGMRMPLYAIERIEDHTGELVFDHTSVAGEQVIRADHAYLISDILADNRARTPAFGPNSILNLPFKAAAKTGTTNDFRDNWTLGFTPDIAIGVWIGNADYTPMKNISGVTGAAPLWADMMQWAVDHYTNGTPSSFPRPSSIDEEIICSVSGTEPSDLCPNEKTEIFARDQPPLPEEEDLWNEIEVDTWTNLKAGPACSEFTEEKLTLQIKDKWAKEWVMDKEDGHEWAESMGFSDPVIFTPERECRGDDPRPTIVFVGLTDEMTVTSSPLDIYAVVTAANHYDRYGLQYGVGDDPGNWQNIANGDEQYKQPEKLASWDLNNVNAARVTLRIYMYSTEDTFAEKRIRLNLMVPTLTPTITSSPTITLTPTETRIPTDTAIPSDTPVPSNTPIPTETTAPAP